MTARQYADGAVVVHHGDALDVLRADRLGYPHALGYHPPLIPDASVDSVVTDPPYGLEFMGREWDSFRPASARIRTRVDQRTNPAEGKSVTSTPEAYVAGVPFQRWCEAWAREVLRVLKPGGHLLAFGGTRTVHRLTCAIEDAGFEIRDGIDWLYASGFPKSLDVSKAIDKAAGAERAIVGERRYADGTIGHWTPAETYAQDDWSTTARGKLETAPATDDARRWAGWGTALKPAREPIVVARKPLAGTVAATVLACGTGALNIDGCRVAYEPDDARLEWIEKYGGRSYAAAARNRVYGERDSQTGGTPAGRWPSNVVLSHAATLDGVDLCADGCVDGCPVAELDRQSGSTASHGVSWTGSGGAVYGGGRGFTAGMPRTAERAPVVDAGGAARFFPVFRYEAKAPASERPRDGQTAHPTVKPLDLMRWLVRLVTPPGGTVLDLFGGSGTTGEACVVEGFRCVLIEREADYLPLIAARLTKPLQPALDIFGGML